MHPPPPRPPTYPGDESQSHSTRTHAQTLVVAPRLKNLNLTRGRGSPAITRHSPFRLLPFPYRIPVPLGAHTPQTLVASPPSQKLNLNAIHDPSPNPRPSGPRLGPVWAPSGHRLGPVWAPSRNLCGQFPRLKPPSSPQPGRRLRPSQLLRSLTSECTGQAVCP